MSSEKDTKYGNLTYAELGEAVDIHILGLKPFADMGHAIRYRVAAKDLNECDRIEIRLLELPGAKEEYIFQLQIDLGASLYDQGYYPGEGETDYEGACKIITATARQRCIAMLRAYDRMKART